jgi:hypothetical protein
MIKNSSVFHWQSDTFAFPLYEIYPKKMTAASVKHTTGDCGQVINGIDKSDTSADADICFSF